MDSDFKSCRTIPFIFLFCLFVWYKPNNILRKTYKTVRDILRKRYKVKTEDFNKT